MPAAPATLLCRPIFGDAEVEIEELTKALWDAPFAVLMHEVEASCCPSANQLLLLLFILGTGCLLMHEVEASCCLLC